MASIVKAYQAELARIEDMTQAEMWTLARQNGFCPHAYASKREQKELCRELAMFLAKG